jgi:hypothetical protein
MSGAVTKTHRSSRAGARSLRASVVITDSRYECANRALAPTTSSDLLREFKTAIGAFSRDVGGSGRVDRWTHELEKVLTTRVVEAIVVNPHEARNNRTDSRGLVGKRLPRQ